MNKDINHTLMALVPILNMNGEKVKTIEAVKDWYKVGDREYCKEVAEITYQNGHRRYADIGCDSNLTAIYDTVAVIQEIKSGSEKIERIERGVYEMPEFQEAKGKGYSVETPCEHPVWEKHEVIGSINISRKDADKLNALTKSVYIGFTKEEHDLLNNGSEEMLIRAGFTK